MEKNKETQKQETLKSAIQVGDCSENKKIVISHAAGCVSIVTQDRKSQENSFIVFRLKSPFAKNYRKIAQALLLVEDCIEELLEIRKP